MFKKTHLRMFWLIRVKYEVPNHLEQTTQEANAEILKWMPKIKWLSFTDI